MTKCPKEILGGFFIPRHLGMCRSNCSSYKRQHSLLVRELLLPRGTDFDPRTASFAMAIPSELKVFLAIWFGKIFEILLPFGLVPRSLLLLNNLQGHLIPRDLLDKFGGMCWLLLPTWTRRLSPFELLNLWSYPLLVFCHFSASSHCANRLALSPTQVVFSNSNDATLVRVRSYGYNLCLSILEYYT